ncbi:MAG: hypothetical protein RI580_11880 [Halothece sp. Uz-M2-17]|nr:hypothetical protein [Halothece sp. Uz-M2-17]
MSLTPNEKGIIDSQVFPGLRLNQSALIAGEMQPVMMTLQEGLSSKENQQFLQ